VKAAIRFPGRGDILAKPFKTDSRKLFNLCSVEHILSKSSFHESTASRWQPFSDMTSQGGSGFLPNGVAPDVTASGIKTPYPDCELA
jgi:hypothetical protein